MGKLGRYEIDAVVSTILDQIEEKSKDSAEMVEYRRLLQLKKDLEEEGNNRLRIYKEELALELNSRSEGLKVTSQNYNIFNVVSPKKPNSTVDNSLIERDIIIANISGNVDETITKIVEKYTK